MHSIKPQFAASILIALSLFACKSSEQTSLIKATHKTDVSRFETASILHNLTYTLIDSVIELSPRDTVTRVRYVRAKSEVQSNLSATENQTLTDTIHESKEESVLTPIAAAEYKKGVSVASRRVRMANTVLFIVFLTIFIVSVKKMLLLRRK